MSKVVSDTATKLTPLDPLGRDPVRKEQVLKVVLPLMLVAFLVFLSMVGTIFSFRQWMLDTPIEADGDPIKALLLPLAFLLTFIPSAIIAVAARTIALSLSAKVAPVVLETNFRDFFKKRNGIFESERDYKSNSGEDAVAAFLFLELFVAILLSVTAYYWSLPAGELIITVFITGGVAVMLIIIGFLATLLLSDEMTYLGDFLFARFIFGSAGLLSAKVIMHSSIPHWVLRWLDKSDWHEETARALLPEFEGNLLELATISRSLGPDA